MQKRSSLKDYCPGYLDLAAGGCVGMNEDEDENAKRELQEELGIVEPDPKYLFNFPYEDENSRCWIYVYYQIYRGQIKAQEAEIDALFYWNEQKIREKIATKAKFTPDSIIAFNRFMPYWIDINNRFHLL